jgi:hypothetical protein
MFAMSHPYDPNQNPNPQSQPSANPYEQPAQSYPPAGQYPPAQQGQYPPAQQGQYAPQPYGGQPYGVGGGEHPQGTMIFVLGIVGIFVGVCAPIAWILGNKALNEIRASGASYSNESQIRTGRMLGKVFTIIYIVFIVLYIIAIIAFLGLAGTQGVR